LLDAFELDALDYLVKPISFERFLKAVNKFLSASQNNEINEKVKNESKDYIILKSEKKNYKINFKSINFIESLDNYIKVNTDDFSIICYESLSGLEKLLPKSLVRIHRSFVVNVDKVTVFTSSFVEIGERRFTIGRNYKDEALKYFN